jgi:hypothetical protein
MTGHIDWAAVSAISGPVLGLVGWIGRKLSKKLDDVGHHLARQDVKQQQLSERVARLEGPVRQAVNGLPANPAR